MNEIHEEDVHYFVVQTNVFILKREFVVCVVYIMIIIIIITYNVNYYTVNNL